MSTLAAQTYLTPAEYLNMERKAVTKNEYLSGQIIISGKKANGMQLNFKNLTI